VPWQALSATGAGRHEDHRAGRAARRRRHRNRAARGVHRATRRPRAGNPWPAAGRSQRPARRGTGHGGRASGRRRAVRPGRVPGLRHPAPAQGQPAHRGAHAVRRAAPGQPPLVELSLHTADGPHVQPARCHPPRADHPGVVLPADTFRRAGVLRAVRRPAQRDPVVGPGPARHHGAAAGAGHRATPGERTRRRAIELHHRVPRRVGRAAPPGPAAGRRPRRRLRPLQHPTDPARRLVRGDRRQDHARRRWVMLLRLRADLRHQTQTAAVRSACRPRDAGQPAGHLPHRRRRRHLPTCPATSTRRPSICWTGSTSRCASPC